MKRHLRIPAVVLLLTAALALHAATSTQPSEETPPVITLFAAPPAAADAKLQKMLKEVRFDKVALRDALDWLRDEAGLNLVVNWTALASSGVERKTPISAILNDVTAAEALEVICREAAPEAPFREMGFQAEGNLVFVSTNGDLGQRTITRIYDIADLLRLEHMRRDTIASPRTVSPGWTNDEIIEDIVRVIQETVAPDVWREVGGSQGAIRALSGRLIITQTPVNHRKVNELLDALRSARVPIPMPGTRPATRAVGSTDGSGLFGG